VFSQLLEGLEALFRLPTGCFEQTSSTTYPNVLVLDYLKRTNTAKPATEAMARDYIQRGYQRLLSFEVKGGGFDWYGKGPANRTLTAYGLMEFSDMARVHSVDPKVIERTRNWLLSQRQQDGSWPLEGHQPNVGVQGRDRLATTAYIAWAVFDGNAAADQAGPTRAFLTSHRPESINDPYVVALVCHALLSIDPSGAAAQPYLRRLEELKSADPDDPQNIRVVCWTQAGNERTLYHGAARSGQVETTALATLALLRGKGSGGTISKALAWLIKQRDPQGAWYSTQATVLSLKALLAAAGKPLGGDGRRTVEVRLRLGPLVLPLEDVDIAADQAEVMKQIELPRELLQGGAEVLLTERTKTEAGYQVSWRYHVRQEKRRGGLAVELKYSDTKVNLHGTIQATATVRTKSEARMVMLELPLPPGFVLANDPFAALVRQGLVERYQIEAGRVLLYLNTLSPDRPPLEIRYLLRATLPAEVTAPGARTYEYYAPQHEATSEGTRLTVRP
jgi:uncharacterized protein YfaS (alpha-2-macroglobulin family)